MKAIVVPCTREKIWDEEPGLGAVSAKNAYTFRCQALGSWEVGPS